MIETKRLRLRELRVTDFEALFSILSDQEMMRYYPKPFDEERVRHWIRWNQENYRKYGFGLWAVILKETDELIGDCGITIQNINGKTLPEIGYHIKKEYWRRGLGGEAALAVRDWGFINTKFDGLYSYMKYTNIASSSTASSIGMHKVKEYPSEENTITYVYAVTREEWQSLKRKGQ